MTKTAIAAIHARQILDSRGRPTVEVDLVLASGAMGRAAVPSGASTGASEAHELRDGDPDVFFGRGVRRAVGNVETVIAPAIVGRDAADQTGLDETMRTLDGTPNLGRLGANAVLGVSLAACRAVAVGDDEPLHARIGRLAGTAAPLLPLPMINILSGGLHAGRSMDLQDFLAIPIGAGSYGEALHQMVRLRGAADAVAARRGLPVLLADEGGISPGCVTVRDALDLMMAMFAEAGLQPGQDVAIALDMAASALADDGGYLFGRAGRRYSAEALCNELAGWVRDYPILSVEDPLHEEDWVAWQSLTARLPSLQLVGDDLFTTDPARIRRGIALGAANCVLIKPNQIGTLSGTLDAVAEARRAGYRTIVSARSGETDDSFIADLAVGTASGQIKVGSLRSSERLAKYNQLLRIEESGAIPYAGAAALAGDRRSVVGGADRR